MIEPDEETICPSKTQSIRGQNFLIGTCSGLSSVSDSSFTFVVVGTALTSSLTVPHYPAIGLCMRAAPSIRPRILQSSFISLPFAATTKQFSTTTNTMADIKSRVFFDCTWTGPVLDQNYRATGEVKGMSIRSSSTSGESACSQQPLDHAS